MKRIYFGLAGFFLLFSACSKLFPAAPAVDEVMDAPLEGLTAEQNKTFLEGADAFDRVFTAEDGLGPIFVATSCGGCHGGDNRGELSTALVRFGQTDSTGNKFLAMGGPQIQHFAIPGYSPESLPHGATSSRFLAPIVAGSGFLELVSDADILAMADPTDSNNDGISGVPNYNNVPSWANPTGTSINGKFICRFGRKASTYNLIQQTTTAYNQDMGITSSFLPNNPVNPNSGASPLPSAGAEVTNRAINANVFYLQALQPPFQRTPSDPTVLQGKAVFIKIGCEKCHKETLTTGFSPVKPLNQVAFHPYTDLLLHDMGPELDDHYTEGSALTSEWRTTPLWGLGLAKSAVGGYFLLHDGRAHTIEDAILLHGGEGNSSRTAFSALSTSEKAALIKFLESL